MLQEKSPTQFCVALDCCFFWLLGCLSWMMARPPAAVVWVRECSSYAWTSAVASLSFKKGAYTLQTLPPLSYISTPHLWYRIPPNGSGFGVHRSVFGVHPLGSAWGEKSWYILHPFRGSGRSAEAPRFSGYIFHHLWSILRKIVGNFRGIRVYLIRIVVYLSPGNI